MQMETVGDSPAASFPGHSPILHGTADFRPKPDRFSGDTDPLSVLQDKHSFCPTQNLYWAFTSNPELDNQKTNISLVSYTLTLTRWWDAERMCEQKTRRLIRSVWITVHKTRFAEKDSRKPTLQRLWLSMLLLEKQLSRQCWIFSLQMVCTFLL